MHYNGRVDMLDRHEEHISTVVVHPRVMERHPELAEQDVLSAWESCLRAVPRIDRDSVDYMAIGSDAHGRLIEMLVRQANGNGWVIFHAFTPPTKKALRELGMLRR